jgi:hypothetical protein
MFLVLFLFGLAVYFMGGMLQRHLSVWVRNVVFHIDEKHRFEVLKKKNS